MLKIGLYHLFCVPLHRNIKTQAIAKIRTLQLTDKERMQSKAVFHNGKSHAHRMCYLAILLKSKGLKSKEVEMQIEGSSPQSLRTGQAKLDSKPKRLGSRHAEKVCSELFISICARYRRIRKHPKVKPSPWLYAYKTEKQQELERHAKDGVINNLYFEDENHISTEEYAPYGRQSSGENAFIPSQRGYRLNVFGMIDRNNRYEGFFSSSNLHITHI